MNMFTESSGQFDVRPQRRSELHTGQSGLRRAISISLPACNELHESPELPSIFDVVIIGAGPAGSAAAITAARAGLRTLLVDRATFPRYKVCGCCLSPNGVQLLKSLLDGATMSHSFLHNNLVNEVRLHIADRSWDIPTRTGFVIGRDELDNALVQEAHNSGAKVLTDTSAIVTKLGAVPTVQLHARGSVREVRSRCVIVADGLQGRSLERFDELKPKIARCGRIGVGCVWDESDCVVSSTTPTTLEIACTPGRIVMAVASRGYVGVVRLSSGEVNCAAAVDPAWVKERGGPACAVADLCASCELPSPPKGARWYGTPVLTRVRPVIESQGLFIVGDAARYGEPFTGEGMTWALLAGKMVAAHAVSMVRGDYREGDWTLQWQMTIASSMKRSTLLSRALRWPRTLRAAMEVAQLNHRLITSLAGLAGPWGEHELKKRVERVLNSPEEAAS